MNIIDRFTLKHLKLNKRRTLVTVFGVMISVMLVCGFFTFFYSFLNYIRDGFKKFDYEGKGGWYTSYKIENKDQYLKIKNNKNSKSCVTVPSDLLVPVSDFTELLKEVPKGETQESEVSLLNNIECSKEKFSEFKDKLLEGKMPENLGEIVLEEKFLKDNNLKIGDKISLCKVNRDLVFTDLNREEKAKELYGEDFKNLKTSEYKITGKLIDPKVDYSGYSSRTGEAFNFYGGKTLFDENSINSPINIYVDLKKVNRNIYKETENLAKEIYGTLDKDKAKFFYNTEVLLTHLISQDETFNLVMFIFATFVLGTIFLVSVSLIRNSFAISITERTKSLGMIASVGATKGQKMRSVFCEAFIMSFLSIPFGLILGVFGAWVLFAIINNSLAKLGIPSDFLLKVSVAPSILILSAAFSLVTLFLSAFIPALKTSGISPIDAIKQNTFIKLKRKQVKTSKINRKLFGFEGELALKNIKRNKKKYRATVFSLTISIVLFLVISGSFAFLEEINKNVNKGIKNSDIDFICSTEKEKSKDFIKEILNKVKNVSGIKEATHIESPWDFNGRLDLSEINENYKKLYDFELPKKRLLTYYYRPTTFENDTVLIKLRSYDDDYLKEYLKGLNIDFNKFNDVNNPMAFIQNSVTIPGYFLSSNPEKDKIPKFQTVNILNKKENENFKINFLEYTDDKDPKNVGSQEVKIAKFIDEAPFCTFKQSNNDSLENEIYIIVSKDVKQALLEKQNSLLPKKEDIYSNSENKYFTISANLKDELSTDAVKCAEIENAVKAELEEIDDIKFVYAINLATANLFTKIQNFIMKLIVYTFIGLITLVSMTNIFNTVSTSVILRKREFAMLRAVGMTPQSFNKMINFESIFYGIKSLIWGLPISYIILRYMYTLLKMHIPVISFFIDITSLLIVIISVFLIVFVTMFYSSSKIKRENIVDVLKQENI